MNDLLRVRMVVAYDGAAFRGFAENVGVPTVAETLRRSIERVLRTPVELAGAGRTDAGVHARGQVVSFDAPSEGFDPERLKRSVNGLCAPTIVVRSIDVAEPEFHARFSAISRQYRYLVLNRPEPDPFLAATSWHVPDRLDLTAMRLACDPLIGEHDFSSFCRRPRAADGDDEPTMFRRVLSAGWDGPDDEVLTFSITANAFCQQMVRSIVGTLVEVGIGRKRAGDMLGILQARDRHRAGQLAPPHGLCLWDVGYDSL
jgi:tRNA pseudouridine38-40 synthase